MSGIGWNPPRGGDWNPPRGRISIDVSDTYSVPAWCEHMLDDPWDDEQWDPLYIYDEWGEPHDD